MTPDEIDQILGSEDRLEPSSGFAMAVMAAVRRQAAEPPPLRFPWLQFAAGVAASGAMAAAGTVLLLRSEPVLSATSAITAPLAPLAAVTPEIGCAAAAALVSLGLVALPRLLARIT